MISCWLICIVGVCGCEVDAVPACFSIFSSATISWGFPIDNLPSIFFVERRQGYVLPLNMLWVRLLEVWSAFLFLKKTAAWWGGWEAHTLSAVSCRGWIFFFDRDFVIWC